MYAIFYKTWLRFPGFWKLLDEPLANGGLVETKKLLVTKTKGLFLAQRCKKKYLRT